MQSHENASDTADELKVLRYWQNANGTHTGFVPSDLVLQTLTKSRTTGGGVDIHIRSLSKDTLSKIVDMVLDFYKEELFRIFGEKLGQIFQPSHQDGILISIPPHINQSVFVEVEENGAIEIEPKNFQSWIRMEAIPDTSLIIFRVGGVPWFTKAPADEYGHVLKLENGEEFKGFGNGTYNSASRLISSPFFYKHMSFPKDIGIIFKIIKAVIHGTYLLPMNPTPHRRTANTKTAVPS
jgi:hypothetical protein